MIFARIGHGSCYYHWNEIFAGVTPDDLPWRFCFGGFALEVLPWRFCPGGFAPEVLPRRFCPGVLPGGLPLRFAWRFAPGVVLEVFNELEHY